MSSRFDHLAAHIAAEYRAKGYSAARAAAIGRETAADIGRRKYGARRMARLAARGRRKRRRR